MAGGAGGRWVEDPSCLTRKGGGRALSLLSPFSFASFSSGLSDPFIMLLHLLLLATASSAYLPDAAQVDLLDDEQGDNLASHELRQLYGSLRRPPPPSPKPPPQQKKPPPPSPSPPPPSPSPPLQSPSPRPPPAFPLPPTIPLPDGAIAVFPSCDVSPPICSANCSCGSRVSSRSAADSACAACSAGASASSYSYDTTNGVGTYTCSDTSTAGRTDARAAKNKWCSELSVNVAGGCSAYYARANNGEAKLCENPSGGGSMCVGQDPPVYTGDVREGEAVATWVVSPDQYARPRL